MSDKNVKLEELMLKKDFSVEPNGVDHESAQDQGMAGQSNSIQKLKESLSSFQSRMNDKLKYITHRQHKDSE